MNRRPNTAPPQEQSPQRDTFSREIRREAASLIERIPEVLQGRPMIQGLTINGPSSKDLDDALWLEAQADGVCQHCRCGCAAEADTDTWSSATLADSKAILCRWGRCMCNMMIIALVSFVC
jgi:hypothetical protein